MAIGYIELDDWIPFRKMFAYMDASDHYRADELLRKYKLKNKKKNEKKTRIYGKQRSAYCNRYS